MNSNLPPETYVMISSFMAALACIEFARVLSRYNRTGWLFGWLALPVIVFCMLYAWFFRQSIPFEIRAVYVRWSLISLFVSISFMLLFLSFVLRRGRHA